MNGVDLVGVVYLLLWGTLALWFLNRFFLRSEDSFGSLFTTWPITRPKEFYVWMSISAVIVALLCIELFTEDNATILAKQHLMAPGTLIEYHGDHGNFRYAFTVHGMVYHGYSHSEGVGVDKIQQGYTFPVYYNPANPNINNASEPIRSLVVGQVMVSFFCVLLMGLLAIIIRKLGALKRASSPPPLNGSPN